MYDVFGVSWKNVDPHSADSGIDPALGEALAPVWHHFTGALRVPDGVLGLKYPDFFRRASRAGMHHFP